MIVARNLLIVLLCCLIVAWLAGPAGRFLVVLAVLLFGPGYLLERTVQSRLPVAALVRPALWLGLSISCVVLLYQWATLVGLSLLPTILPLLTAGCTAGCLWAAGRDLGLFASSSLVARSGSDRDLVRTRISRVRTRSSSSLEPGSGGRAVQALPLLDDLDPDRAEVLAGPELPARQQDPGGAGYTASEQPVTYRTHMQSAHKRIPARRWGIVFLALLGLTLWLRFVQIQDLVLPAWVDSVHHALLIRIVAETGQAPYSLRPYLPVDHLAYHWGYHAFTASVMRMSGLPLVQTMLWSGQMLNALHVLTCGALAAFWWRRPLAGIGAGLITGVISIMPAYYVSWGRYTQLTGLLLLPALAIAWHMLLQTGTRRWLALTSILLAGMSIVHFRVLIFAGALLAVQALVWAVDQPWNHLRARATQGLAMGLLALLLALPWLWLVVAQQLLPAVDQPQSLAGGGNYNAASAGLLWAGLNRWLIPLALLAALWGLARRMRTALILTGWVCALVILANPWLISYLLPAGGLLLALWAALHQRWLLTGTGIVLMALNPAFVRIPYFWLITNDAMLISLFVPLSLLIGGGICLLADWLVQIQKARIHAIPPAASPTAVPFQSSVVHMPRSHVPLVYLLYIGLSSLAIWGAWNSRIIINPVTVFVTPADRQAIDWITEHTPDDARFLINAVSWLSPADRGNDGGYWLTPLTGRWTSTPPALFTYGDPAYVQAVQARSSIVRDVTAGQEQQLHELIAREQITHIYLTDHSGPLQTDLFAGRDDITPVYQHDGVTILAVRQEQ